MNQGDAEDALKWRTHVCPLTKSDMLWVLRDEAKASAELIEAAHDLVNGGHLPGGKAHREAIEAVRHILTRIERSDNEPQV